MVKVFVYTDDKSKSYRLFYSDSTTGRTTNGGVNRLKVENRDQLISNAIANTPDDGYILVAYGPLLTTMNSKQIFDAIEYAIENIQELDILYLTIYSDDCPLNTDERTYENMVFKRTVSPHGTECILITPKGVESILNTINGEDGRGYDFYLNSAGEKMMLYTANPPIMMVDISRRSDDTKLIKTTLCREVISSVKPIELTRRYTGNMNLFWFFLIVVFILFIAAMMLSFSEREIPKNTDNDKNIRDPGPMGKQHIGEFMSPFQSTAL